jgi:predicted AAA+ superfamily ATPase
VKWHRNLYENIAQSLEKEKVIVLYGARQVGKTTLIREVVEQSGLKYIQISGEDTAYQHAFSQASLRIMQDVVGNNQLLFIDEAQAIPDIGLNIKILHDAAPKLKIILTGSSSFDLANSVKEPLTGRTITTQLHPVSIGELSKDFTPFEIKQKLEEFILYGMYPEVLTLGTSSEKKSHLKELSESYLYKDVLQLTSVKHTRQLHDLLKLVAYQIGNLVSIQELSKSLKLSFDTGKSYLEILEKAFVIKTLRGYSKNPRKEISKMDKVYFIDTGIRNAIINDFSSLDFRTDVGGLWENFLIMERIKRNDYTGEFSEQFFWRKYSGAEVDYIETGDGLVKGYEFKWGKKKSRSGVSWQNDYPAAGFEVVSKEDWLGFVKSD